MRDSTANYNFRTFRAVAHSWNSKALLTGFFLYYTTEIIKAMRDSTANNPFTTLRAVAHS